MQDFKSLALVSSSINSNKQTIKQSLSFNILRVRIKYPPILTLSAGINGHFNQRSVNIVCFNRQLYSGLVIREDILISVLLKVVRVSSG